MKCLFVAWMILSLPFDLFSQKLVMPVGHTSAVSSVSFDITGKKVLTSSADGTAKIWNSETGHLLANFKNASFAVYTPDKKKIITQGETVSMWDAGTCQYLYSLPKEENLYEQVLFPAHGKTFITEVSGFTKIWETATGNLLADCGGTDRDWFFYGLFADNDRIFVNLRNQDTIQVWDTRTGELLQHIELYGGAYNLAVSPDGKYIVVNGDLDVYEISTGEKIEINIDASDETEDDNNNSDSSFYRFERTFGFSPSGNIFFYEEELNGRHSIILLDFKTMKPIRKIMYGNDYADSITISPDEKIVTLYTSSMIAAWNINAGKELFSYKHGWGDRVISDDGSVIFIQKNGSDSIHAYNRTTGELLFAVKHPNFTSVALSKDHRQMVTADGIGFAVVWNVADLTVQALLMEKITGLQDIAINPAANQFIPFTYSSDVSLKDLNSGRELQKATLSRFPVFGTFSHSGKIAMVITTDSAATAWSTQDGKQFFRIKGSTFIYHISFSSDDKKVLITEERKLKLYDVATGKLLKQFAAPTGDFTKAILSGDGKYIASFGYGSRSKDYKTLLAKRLTIWNVQTGKIVTIVNGHADMGVWSANFSHNSKKISIGAIDKLLIYDLTTLSSSTLKKPGFTTVWTSGVFSPDDTQITTAHNNAPPKTWNVSNGKLLKEFTANSEAEIFSPQYSKDGKRLLAVSSDDRVYIWNVADRKILCHIKDTSDKITDVYWTADERKVICRNGKQSMKIWDYSNCSHSFDVYATSENNLVYKLPDGYYMSSPEAAKLLHYVSDDLNVITFDQLDIRYNRPDIVLQQTGSSDTALIRAFNKAWQKRMKKLGIDTTAFTGKAILPESDIINREKIEYSRKNRMLELNIHAEDAASDLDRLNLWVNGVPVFGVNGISIREYKVKRFDSTFTVNLSEGKNIIETSVVNVKALESFKKPLQVQYNGTGRTPSLYFVGIGIDHFRDSTYDLSWSVKDIRDLAAAFEKKYKDKIHIDTLYNQDVTVENIRRLKQKLVQAGEDDKVIVAYSGHGLLSKDFDYYLSTYDVNFADPQKQGLSYEELENLLDGISSRKKLILIDACHSGEVDKEELARYEVIQQALDSTQKGITIRLKKDQQKIGMKNSFELMQELFTNIGRGTGATVISAAGGMQFALERGDLRNGVFSFSILELMEQKPHASLALLKMHVNKRVVELTKGAQVPTARHDNTSVD